MFVWKERREQKENADRTSGISDGKGLNKRAIGLFPQSKDKEPQKIDLNSQIGFTNFLVQLEGKETTCVVRIISPKAKTRASVLVFRGRVLGCLWGRDNNNEQVLGRDAFACVQDDMLQANPNVDYWEIDDKTAIAASSIFHGEVFSPSGSMKPQEILDYALQNLLASNLPGSIVLSEPGGTKAILYIFKGKIHGFFSFAKGWIDPSSDDAKSLMSCTINTEVAASKLNCFNIWEMKPYTFSVTGLNDERKTDFTSPSMDYGALPTPEAMRKEGLKNVLAKQEKPLAGHLKSEVQERKVIPGPRITLNRAIPSSYLAIVIVKINQSRGKAHEKNRQSKYYAGFGKDR